MKGLLFAIITAILWGMAPMFEKAGIAKLDPFTAITLRSCVIATLLVILFLTLGKASHLPKIDLRSVILVVIGGICAGLLGQWTYFKALKLWEASKVVPVAATYPLFAMVFSIVLLGESFTWVKAAGTLLVVTGIFLLR